MNQFIIFLKLRLKLYINWLISEFFKIDKAPNYKSLMAGIAIFLLVANILIFSVISLFADQQLEYADISLVVSIIFIFLLFSSGRNGSKTATKYLQTIDQTILTLPIKQESLLLWLASSLSLAKQGAIVLSIAPSIFVWALYLKSAFFVYALILLSIFAYLILSVSISNLFFFLSAIMQSQAQKIVRFAGIINVFIALIITIFASREFFTWIFNNKSVISKLYGFFVFLRNSIGVEFSVYSYAWLLLVGVTTSLFLAIFNLLLAKGAPELFAKYQAGKQKSQGNGVKKMMTAIRKSPLITILTKDLLLLIRGEKNTVSQIVNMLFLAAVIMGLGIAASSTDFLRQDWARAYMYCFVIISLVFFLGDPLLTITSVDTEGPSLATLQQAGVKNATIVASKMLLHWVITAIVAVGTAVALISTTAMDFNYGLLLITVALGISAINTISTVGGTALFPRFDWQYLTQIASAKKAKIFENIVTTSYIFIVIVIFSATGTLQNFKIINSSTGIIVSEVGIMMATVLVSFAFFVIFKKIQFTGWAK